MSGRYDRLLVGLDVGTHSVRALAFDPRGELIAVEAVPTPTETLGPGQAEYRPEALWKAALGVFGRVVAKLPRGVTVAGVAAASIGESCVLLDAAGEPVHNALIWYDRRTAGEARWLAETVGAERLHAITGLPVDPTYGICKLLWLRTHASEAFARGRHVLNVADWIAYCLSGEMATDYSLASRTGVLDLFRRRWSVELLGAVDMDPGLFAPLRPSGHALGPVRREVADELGLSGPCMVGVGGHDHICGGVAAGTHRPGLLLDSMGTAEALLLTVARPPTGDAVRKAGFAQGAMEVGAPYAYLGAAINSAGGSVEWFRETLAEHTGYEDLIASADATPPGAEGVCFVPHLAFRPPPAPDPRARGAFLGLTAGVGRGALFRAVLEGLAMEARRVVDGMTGLPGLSPPTEIRVIGGGTRNALQLRIKASVYDRPLTVVDEPETTALGAAILGGLAAEVYPDLDDAHRRLVHPVHSVLPDAEWAGRYREIFRVIYGQADVGLRAVNQAIASVFPVRGER